MEFYLIKTIVPGLSDGEKRMRLISFNTSL